MTMAARDMAGWDDAAPARVLAPPRDAVIDTMRGAAIVMVVAIHSLPASKGSALVIAIDAFLRPCVPIFLFASGYLSAHTVRIPLGRRVKRLLGPYTIAFIAAYIFMAVQNPSMDHRPAVTALRYGLAYVFVYYYVFVYFGCTVALALAFAVVGGNGKDHRPGLIAVLSLAIVAGLTVGAYLDPLLARLGASPSLIEEARLRDIPFWFAFVALGAIVGMTSSKDQWKPARFSLAALTAAAFLAYAAVRIWNIGDAADYDSIAFFLYAVLLCLTLLAFGVTSSALAGLGAASYFIYLWHIFPIMLLRAWPALQPHAVAACAVEFTLALAASAVLAALIRRIGFPRLSRWLGV
jgi:surface polysaccharide O-acyltransferase-like enzyme